MYLMPLDAEEAIKYPETGVQAAVRVQGMNKGPLQEQQVLLATDLWVQLHNPFLKPFSTTMSPMNTFRILFCRQCGKLWEHKGMSAVFPTKDDGSPFGKHEREMGIFMFLKANGTKKGEPAFLLVKT